MAYVAPEKFKFARDSIGVDVVCIESGIIDIKSLKLSDKNIEWLLRNDLIKADSDLEDSKEEESEAKVCIEEVEIESVVEFEIDNSPMTVIEKIKDKKELDEYAEELGIKLDRRKGLEKMRKQFKEEYENKMMGEIENKS